MATSPNISAFSPIRIGPIELSNRIVMSAINTNYASPEGEVTERFVEFYRARARGCVGLIITGYSYVHPTGRGPVCMLGSHDDRLIPGLRRFVEAVHAEGAKASLQLAHVGRAANPKIIGTQPVAPSPIAGVSGDAPRELTFEEINQLVEAFAQAADRARRAGLDAVEIHMAHGYLLSQFLSPYSNKRTDSYGGSVENRARFPLAVLRRVKEVVGADLAVTCKINGHDFVDGGIDLEEAKLTARLLEEAGADAITVSAGADAASYMGVQPPQFPRGCLVSLAEGVKSVVKIPVGAVGRLNHPDVIEEVLSGHKADFVVLARALVADPEFAKKWAEGRPEDICPCTACSFGCIWRVRKGLDMACSDNAQAGMEAVRKIVPAARPRNVVVVGGGPAGLEAARVAALRGHNITLVEKNRSLGGLLNVGSVPPYKYELRSVVSYYANQLEKLGVTTILDREATEDDLRRLSPEVAIVACGGRPNALPVDAKPGFALQVTDVLSDNAEVGKRIAIVGGNSVGCETAEYLAEKGCKVTILEMMDDFATDIRPEMKKLMADRLDKLGVEILIRSKVTSVREGEIVFVRDGREEILRSLDNVLFAMGSSPDLTLVETAKKLGIEAFAIGDCAKPGNIFDAIHSAFEVACRI